MEKFNWGKGVQVGPFLDHSYGRPARKRGWRPKKPLGKFLFGLAIFLALSAVLLAVFRLPCGSVLLTALVVLILYRVVERLGAFR